MKFYEKAGQEGWKAAVPFYNLYSLLKLQSRPMWWLILLAIPLLNIFIFAQLIMDMLKSYSRTSFMDYLLGLLFTPIYFFYLGATKDIEFEGPAAELPKIKKSTLRDWTDSIIFAVVAATLIRWFLIEAFTIPTPSMERSLLVGDFLFVSKVNYGPRIPITPLSFPFAHNTLPLTDGAKSYIEKPSLPYYRIPGLETIERRDVVVFNHPTDFGRPIDKKDNFIKRCVAIPGDTIVLRDMQVYVNGQQQEMPEMAQFAYAVEVDQYPLTAKDFIRADISLADWDNGACIQLGANQIPYYNTNNCPVHMTPEGAQRVEGLSKVKSTRLLNRPAGPGSEMYMNFGDTLFPFNIDNFGPLWVPKKGVSIPMTPKHYYFYKRVILDYENAGEEMELKGNTVLLDGVELKEYTFKMDYYWMMGDNRHNSLDSRMWGFVPENHIVGKALFIWFSYDKHKSGLFNSIRWDRFFNPIN